MRKVLVGLGSIVDGSNVWTLWTVREPHEDSNLVCPSGVGAFQSRCRGRESLTIALDYSPNWDAQLFEWTQSAIDQGFRGQVREEFQILNFVQDKLLTGPGGAAFGSSGFSINCPIAQRLD